MPGASSTASTPIAEKAAKNTKRTTGHRRVVLSQFAIAKPVLLDFLFLRLVRRDAQRAEETAIVSAHLLIALVGARGAM